MSHLRRRELPVPLGKLLVGCCLAGAGLPSTNGMLSDADVLVYNWSYHFESMLDSSLSQPSSSSSGYFDFCCFPPSFRMVISYDLPWCLCRPGGVACPSQWTAMSSTVWSATSPCRTRVVGEQSRDLSNKNGKISMNTALISGLNHQTWSI
jgi:hypothetical protein